nr:immunoglobulin light chain junction region [Macaca mulatta]
CQRNGNWPQLTF